MGPLGAVVGTITAALVGFGGFKVYGFVQGIKEYRRSAMAATVDVPPAWLQLVSAQPARPLQFFRINDEVMGGKSTSVLEFKSSTFFSPQGLLFSGVINTNGGGFCSCRTLGDDAPLGLSSNSTLLVDATGDDQLHKVTLMTADSWEMSQPTWAHDFVASKRRSTHKLRLADFVPSKQGRMVKGVTLDAAKVTGIGFTLSLYTMAGEKNQQFGDGPFSLEVHGVKEVLK